MIKKATQDLTRRACQLEAKYSTGPHTRPAPHCAHHLPERLQSHQSRQGCSRPRPQAQGAQRSRQRAPASRRTARTAGSVLSSPIHMLKHKTHHRRCRLGWMMDTVQHIRPLLIATPLFRQGKCSPARPCSSLLITLAMDGPPVASTREISGAVIRAWLTGREGFEIQDTMPGGAPAPTAASWTIRAASIVHLHRHSHSSYCSTCAAGQHIHCTAHHKGCHATIVACPPLEHFQGHLSDRWTVQGCVLHVVRCCAGHQQWPLSQLVQLSA